jgi:hypothetical protein
VLLLMVLLLSSAVALPSVMQQLVAESNSEPAHNSRYINGKVDGMHDRPMKQGSSAGCFATRSNASQPE